MHIYTVFVILLAVWPVITYALMLFVEYTKLDELESYFRENVMVCHNKHYWRRNRPRGRFMRISQIVGFLLMPKLHIRRGLVTELELAAVPLSLKRWAFWPYLTAIIWLVTAVVWCIWLKW